MVPNTKGGNSGLATYLERLEPEVGEGEHGDPLVEVDAARQARGDGVEHLSGNCVCLGVWMFSVGQKCRALSWFLPRAPASGVGRSFAARSISILPTCPMRTERMVMTVSAAMDPVKEMRREVFIASSPGVVVVKGVGVGGGSWWWW